MSLPTLFTYGNCDYNLIIKWEQGDIWYIKFLDQVKKVYVGGIYSFQTGVQETMVPGRENFLCSYKIKICWIQPFKLSNAQSHSNVPRTLQEKDKNFPSLPPPQHSWQMEHILGDITLHTIHPQHKQ